MALLLTLCLFSAAALVLWLCCSKPRNFPPGPPRVPLLGSLPFMPKLPTRRLIMHIGQTMGPIVGVYLGPFRSVVINDLDILKEAFKHDASTGRVPLRPINEMRYGGSDGRSRGLTFSTGEEWQEQRRFTLRHLRDFGFGKKSMEELIVFEVQKFCKEVDKLCNLPFASLNLKVNVSIVNALWCIMTGEALELSDPRLYKIVEAMEAAVAGVESFNPWTRMFPNIAKRVWKGYPKFKAMIDNALSLINPVISEHEKTLDPNNPRDFIDVYLREMAETKSKESSFYGEHGTKSIQIAVFDLFLAGTETTSSSLMWLVLFMAKYPSIQSRVQAEIDSVVGNAEDVRLEHEPDLPYTKAVIVESMRAVTLVPIAVPHLALKDIQVAGYTIPKGTQMIANLAFIHHDPKHWSDPEEFRPERFLSADGTKLAHTDRVIPFNVGKRDCLGKTLAERELFLFFSGLMLRFRVSRADGHELPATDMLHDRSVNFVRTAPHFNISIQRR